MAKGDDVSKQGEPKAALPKEELNRRLCWRKRYRVRSPISSRC